MDLTRSNEVPNIGKNAHAKRGACTLPPTIETVVPPAVFSPSHIGAADECLLRAVLGTTRVVSSLPAHPVADLGAAFHLLLERAVRGQIERRGEAEADARRELGVILDEANARLAKRLPANSRLDLRTVLTPLVWRRKLRMVLDMTVRYLERAVPGRSVPQTVGTDSSSGVIRDFDTLPPIGTFAEVRMRTLSLRIAGRADFVEKVHSHVIIRDLKTGRVTDENGIVRSHVARQLRLYGVMARNYAPTVSVRLFVDDGTEREVSFGAIEAEETEAWLTSVLTSVPDGVHVRADSIATFGRACGGCGFRHVCPSYRRRAPEKWEDGAPYPLATDVWGEVVRIEPVADGMCRLQIRDAAGRLVTVSGLAPARVECVVPGEELYLFNLHTHSRTGGSEASRHPRNFFEIAPNAPYERAWSLIIFTSNAISSNAISD